MKSLERQAVTHSGVLDSIRADAYLPMEDSHPVLRIAHPCSSSGP